MRIFLIGFMGAGKSFWGKQWAAHFNYSFVDLDDVIIKREGQDIVSVFEKKGEEYFRQVEAKVLREASKEKNIIVSCGGGTPCFNNNMQWMNENGCTIYLDKTPVELLNNIVKEKLQRPLLKNLNDEELFFFIEQKLKERLPFYTRAKIILTGSQLTIDSLNTIINKNA